MNSVKRIKLWQRTAVFTVGLSFKLSVSTYLRCWTTHSSQRCHSLMLRSINRCESLLQKLTHMLELLDWVVAGGTLCIKWHPKQCNYQYVILVITAATSESPCILQVITFIKAAYCIAFWATLHPKTIKLQELAYIQGSMSALFRPHIRRLHERDVLALQVRQAVWDGAPSCYAVHV